MILENLTVNINTLVKFNKDFSMNVQYNQIYVLIYVGIFLHFSKLLNTHDPISVRELTLQAKKGTKNIYIIRSECGGILWNLMPST